MRLLSRLQRTTAQTLPDRTNRLEEYKICQEQATRLESNIWHTAGLLGVGTAISLVTVAAQKPPFAVVLLAGVFAINVSLIWWRFVRRWGSIQSLYYRRMAGLEELLGFELSKLVAKYDRLATGQKLQRRKQGRIWEKFIFRVFYNRDKQWDEEVLIRDYDEFIKGKDAINWYEYRGIQPVCNLLVKTSIFLWWALVMASAFSCQPIIENLSFSALALLVLLIMDISLWRQA